jgi:hypothetical protein
MGEDQLLAFLLATPFEPFVMVLVGGREIEVRHAEFVTPSRAGLGLWILHDSGQVEAIGGSNIVSIKTVGPVDPAHFVN